MKMATLSPKKAITYSLCPIPPQATHLIFILYDPHSFTNDPLTKPFPTTLTHLTLQNFGESVDKVPHSITRLVVSTNFNKPVDKLPPTLTHLTTGDDFNQPVNKLPPTLTHLTTGNNFNQPVDNLPPTLTHLTTGDDFNQLVNKLPPTLTSQLGINLTN
jgi:hypothetical protein